MYEEDYESIIREAILHGFIMHVMSLPLEHIKMFFNKNVITNDADILYFLMVQKYGDKMYYNNQGRHLVSINPELTGAYIVAGGNIYAPIVLESNIQDSKDIKDTNDLTIYSLVINSFKRIFISEGYFNRLKIMQEENMNISGNFSAAVNLPYYQEKYFKFHKIGIEYDYWDVITELNSVNIQCMISRTIFVKSMAPAFFKKIMKGYYLSHLIRLNIKSFMKRMHPYDILLLINLFPEYLYIPENIKTRSFLGIKLWISDDSTRAYLLGFDIYKNIPDEVEILKSIQNLENIGIESFVKEVTGIKMENGSLTGYIGREYYPELIGKKLLNENVYIYDRYYPFDIFFIHDEKSVFLMTPLEVVRACYNFHSIEDIRYEINKISGLIVSDSKINQIVKRMRINPEIIQGLPAINQLLDLRINVTY